MQTSTFNAANGGFLKVHLKMASTFTSSFADVAEQMVAFMNSDDCGPVVGVSITLDWPGLAWGIVAHGDVPGAEPASKEWSVKCISSNMVGMLVSRDNHYKTLEKIAGEACADPVATTARFMTAANSDVSAVVALFSPNATEKGALSVKTFMGKMPGMLVSATNLTGAVTAAGKEMLEHVTSSAIDISVGSTDVGAYVAVWSRAGGPLPSATLSTVQCVKSGLVSRGTFHKCMESVSVAVGAYQGPILFDMDATTVVTHGLVLHGQADGQPPALNVVQKAAGGEGCCVVA